MLAVFWFLIMTMMMWIKSEAAELITVRSGEPVQLTPKGLKEARLKRRTDIRWTHQHLVLSLQNNATRCHHKRCVMQSDGTLAFTYVESSDAGNYSLQVFDAKGKVLMKEDFQLRVVWAGQSRGGSTALISLLIIPLILLFIIMTYFFYKRRQGQMTVTTGPIEENLYVEMHGKRVNKRLDEGNEEKKREEEESPYVPCHPLPAVSMETPITQQKTVEEEDIYV